MSYKYFKIKNNCYFNEAEKGKWNRKISTLVSTNMALANDEDRIHKIILKLERKRIETSSKVPEPIPLSRLVENFNRRKTDVTRDEWDIPILHLVKKCNWRNF
ncbi:hypothetical protein [Leptospira bandrabouensis]|uniref:Uncharacterized protein n=1 Tax=Leptospira bandrabouensis TaxID=2484903 RepID=A0A6H3NLY1_9LEPT|nr:hypothetical protein [Leptospira bandrabouensis]TGN09966.1 hypothetical protein EHR07_00370 [Leptospira bandrabouensis]TGN12376.1 hypothetical protein EHR08_13420 [Leptospira bandrabouensis]